MKTASEVTCIGEVLVDFVSNNSGVNLSGALTAMRYGVFDALPNLIQVKNFLKNNR
jgi:hypothetical protein